MRLMRFCRPGLAHGLAALGIVAGASQASAQDRPKIEITPQIPHSQLIKSVAFSPNGSRVVSGSQDTTVKLWDAATGALVRTFEGHSHLVTSVAFSPDGSRVLSGSYDKTLKLWDATTGGLVHTIFSHSVESVAFSPDGARVLSGSSDKTLKLWDAVTGVLMRTFEGHTDKVSSVAFSPDGKRVLSGGDDKTLKLWDLATGALMRTFEAHTDRVTSVAFSPDGRRVLSGSDDSTLKLWDVATGALMRTFRGHTDKALSIAFSPDGNRVVSGSSDRTLRLWNEATGALLHTFEGHSYSVNSVAFSPDGSRVLSGSGDFTLKLWDAASGALVRTSKGNLSGLVSVAFSPDGKRVLSGGDDETLKLWDMATGALLRTFEGHTNRVMSVAFSPDGTRVVSGSWDRTLKLWDVATGALMRNFEGHTDRVMSVAFSPDGTRVLSGSMDRTVKLWDSATGALVRTFEGHSDIVTRVAFSPDGSRVLSGGYDRAFKLWDSATGALVRNFEGHSHSVSSVAFSPDGSHVLSGSFDRTLKLWDSATGALARNFEGHSHWVTSVAFSPDGSGVVSAGGYDTTVKLWNTATGALARNFKAHSAWVSSVAFSPDGRRIVSASADTTARIWDPATGAQLAALIVGRDGQWLTKTPAGFFASSGAVDELLGIVRGLEVTTINQVHQSLFNPDLVREALAGDPNGEVREAAEVINLEKVLDSGPAPNVAIASPSSQSATDVVTVKAGITDQGKGIGRIEWRVNGITAAVASKPRGRGPTYAITQQLALDPGDNTIEVVAYNASNLLASLPARTTVKFTGPFGKTKPKLHILAIGINAYVDKGWTPPGSSAAFLFEPLDLAVKDAKAFAANMKKAAAGLYDEVRVTLALDRDATRANLEKIVDTVAAGIHPRDTFILFAAAHGYSTRANGRFYLIPQDHQGGIDPEALAARAIGQDRLQDWLANRIKAKRALILLDTCESGALIAGHARSRTDGPASEAAVGRLHEATGRPVLTAAAVGQSAQEGEIGASGEKHGLFTWAVLDALRKGDSNGNGRIELSELVSHVQTVVPRIAAKGGSRGQAVASEPEWEKQSARFGSRGEDFVVARRLQ